MRTIDLQNWPRKSHFGMFKDYESPHYNMCADVDISQLYAVCKKHSVSSYTAIVYLIIRTVNEVTPFRLRIREDEVVEHDRIHPSFTVLRDDNTFGYCTQDYHPVFDAFLSEHIKRVEQVLAEQTLESGARDDLVYMSCIPWVKFTGISHAMRLMPTDCIPRFSWGKYSKKDGRVEMPLSVQVHHALVDGYDVGRFYHCLQRSFEDFESILKRGE